MIATDRPIVSGLPLDEVPPPAPDLKTLADAANEAAKREAAQWFFFITVMITLTAIVGTTTHRMLLLEAPVKVPLLSIEVPLLGFYVTAPVIFLVLHFYLLVQVRTMADKVQAFLNTASQETKGDQQSLRGELWRLDPFSVAQLLAARRLGDSGVALQLMVWTTLAVAPVALLLFMQVRFLPYHEPWITWWHRAVLVADLIVLWWLWPRTGSYWNLKGLVFGAIGTAATLFFACVLATIPKEAADGIAARIGPALPEFTVKVDAWPLEILWWRLRGHSTVPETIVAQRKYSEKLYQPIFTIPIIPGPQGQPPETWTAALRRALFDGGMDPNTQRPRSLFSRSLVLPDEVLIGADDLKAFRDNPDKALASIARTVVLRGRDLRDAVLDRADLQRADLTGAELRGASLNEAKLAGANLHRAQLQGVRLQLAFMQRAKLHLAQLQGALLQSADMRGAELDRAELQNAQLDMAQLQSASLQQAHLQGASIGGAQLQGAQLQQAHMQGADLYGADLQGAVLFYTELTGANLHYVQMQGALLEKALLQGAYLVGAQLQGASLVGAQLQGAWFDRAQLQGVQLDQAQLQGASLRDVAVWRMRAQRADLVGAVIASLGFGDKPPRAQPIGAPSKLAKCERERSWNEWIEVWVAAATNSAEPKIVRDTVRDSVGARLAVLNHSEDPAGAGMTRKVWENYPLPSPAVVAQRLGDLACDPAQAPYVARGILRQIDQRPYYEPRDLGDDDQQRAALAYRIARKSCLGAGGLTHEELAKLAAIAASRGYD